MSRYAASRYRLDAAEYASPVGVIVQAHDQIIRALRQAASALENGNIEHKTRETDRALLIIGHLQSMLDYEAGPAVAEKLEVFYETMRYQILKASAQVTGEALREVAGYVGTLWNAWQAVERENPVLPSYAGSQLDAAQ